MSALAARRAAAAAHNPTRPATDIGVRPAVSFDDFQSLDIGPIPRGQPSEVDQLESNSDIVPARPLPSSIKRQEIPQRTPPVRPRYFALPASASPPRGIKRPRRFSPSAPASDVDNGDGKDSSDEEQVGVQVGTESGKQYSETPDPLRTPITPAHTSRPTRPKDQALAATATSSFDPRPGENVLAVSEEDLRSAGLDDVPGPGILLSLGERDNIMISGMFNLTPLQLPLSLFSVTLRPPTTPFSYPVFAPTSHPIPVIAPAASGTGATPVTSPILNDLHLPSTFHLADPKTDRLRVIFLVRELSCGLEGMRRGAVPGFSSIWLEDRGSWGLRGVHLVLGSFQAPVYPYISPPSWRTALDSLSPSRPRTNGHIFGSMNDNELTPVIALVKGPKRIGKSTFARAALNHLLDSHEKVAWLECDLGQGEFGNAGAVGLWLLDRPVLGPPFTHLQLPAEAHYLGTYTPLTCPDEYISAIRLLMAHYVYEIQQSPFAPIGSTFPGSKVQHIVPLVVNTQGWVKGLGDELLRTMEAIVQPTHVFAFENPPDEYALDERRGSRSPQDCDPFPVAFGSSVDRTPPQAHLLDWAPVSHLQARYTAADMRILSLMSYFHSCLALERSPTWDFSAPLLAMAPFRVSLGEDGPLRQVHLIGEGGDGVDPNDLHLALNGSVVGLLERLSGPSDEPLYVQGRESPDLDDSAFLGLALVRGVRSLSTSPPKFELLLSSPLPRTVLARASCIVKNGAIELPLCGMLEWIEGARGGPSEEGIAGVGWEEVPFLDVGAAKGVGGAKRRFRKNLQRKGM